jgi:hypothetical protein
MQGEDLAKAGEMLLTRDVPFPRAINAEMIPEQTFSIRYNFGANP